MKLSNLLTTDLIFWNGDVSESQDIYKLLAVTIANKYALSSDDIYEAVQKRDELGHTVYDYGIAMPHGRLDNLKDVIIAIYKPLKSISMHGKDVNLIVMILTSNTGSNLYLKTMSAFAKIIHNSGERLIQCETKDGLLSLISNSNVEVEKSLKIKEIMNKDIYVAKLDNTISDVLDKIIKNNIEFVPVANDEGKYIGKIDISCILKLGYPNYLFAMKDLNFLDNLRAFEDFASQEVSVSVKDLFQETQEKSMNQDESVVALGFSLLKHNWHHLAVVDNDNKIVGIIGTKEMLRNILRV